MYYSYVCRPCYCPVFDHIQQVNRMMPLSTYPYVVNFWEFPYTFMCSFSQPAPSQTWGVYLNNILKVFSIKGRESDINMYNGAGCSVTLHTLTEYEPNIQSTYPSHTVLANQQLHDYPNLMNVCLQNMLWEAIYIVKVQFAYMNPYPACTAFIK